MSECRFCGTAIDPQAVAAFAQIQERVNWACNDAKFIRNTAVAMWIFFVLHYVPFIGIFALLANIFTMFFVPIKIVSWHLRFGKIKTTDTDYQRARRDKNIALLIWLPLPALVVFLFGAIFVAIILRILGSR